MNDERVPPGSKFLAHGAAAEVWLVGAPNLAIRQCVLKMIRLNPETLKENYGPRNSKRAIQLWKEFAGDFRSKVAQWKLLAHINVVRVLDLDENLHLRVEYLAHGSASQYLAASPGDPIVLRKKMIQDVLAGLYYLHTQRSPRPVVHGCIRMDKLFVDADGTTKIGEFGLASLLEDFEFFAPSITQAGQVRWMSPELLQTDTDQRSIPTTASDIWALGCTLFEIVSGKLPYSKYKHDLRVRHEIVSRKAPGLPENLLHPDLADVWTLITSCWEWDHEQRPSIHKLVQHIHLPIARTLAPTAQESQNLNTYDPRDHGLAKSLQKYYVDQEVQPVSSSLDFLSDLAPKQPDNIIPKGLGVQSNELAHVETKEEKQMDVAWLGVPDGEMSRSAIDRLVLAFYEGPGRTARLARCSRCENEGRRNSLHATKPSNLKRHLYNHFSIKCWKCLFPSCGQQFTTQDQAVVHVMDGHMFERDGVLATSLVVPLPEVEDLDDKTESLASDILDL